MQGMRRRKLWIGLLCGLVALLLLLLGFIRSAYGRRLVQDKVQEWLAREYQIALVYEKLEIASQTLGWQIRVHKLRWGYEAEPSIPVEELLVDVRPWNFFLGSLPIEAIAVRGVQIHGQLINRSLKVDGIGPTLSPDLLDSPAGGKTRWPPLDVRLEDIEVALNYGQDQTLQTRINVAWGTDLALTHLDVTSPELELAPLHLPFLESGRIEQLQLNCQNLQSCQGSANLHHMKWAADGVIPSVEELSARLEFSPQRLMVYLPKKIHRMTWPAVYAKSFALGLPPMALTLSYDAERLQIDVPESLLDYAGVETSAKARIRIPWKNPKATHLHLFAKVAASGWDRVRGVLPDQVLSPALNRWLEQNLRQAQIKNVEGQFDGVVTGFPFAAERENRFSIKALFNAAELQFHERWPALTGCNGRFTLRNAALRVEDIACLLGGMPVREGLVVLPQLNAKDREIRVHASSVSAVEKAADFLAASPLKTVGTALTRLEFKGRQQTSIDLRYQLGLDAEKALALSGQTRVQNARFSLPQALFSGSAPTVSVDYNQDGLLRVESEVQHQGERTRVRVQKDAQADALLMTLSGGWDAQLRAWPARAPDFAEGTLSGLKLSGTAAQVNFAKLTWKEGELAFRGHADVQDFGAVSRSLGLPDDYGGGRGSMDFDLKVVGEIKSPISQSLSGQLLIDLMHGELKKLSHTLVTVVDFANLKVFGIGSEKLSYKFLKGTLHFDQGVVRTDDGRVGLGIVEILATGEVDYAHDAMNINLQIIPDLGAPAVAVAIGLWNPLLGLTLYGISRMQNHAADSKLNRMISQTYKLKGSIKDPKISLVKPMNLGEIVK